MSLRIISEEEPSGPGLVLFLVVLTELNDVAQSRRRQAFMQELAANMTALVGEGNFHPWE